MEDAARVSRALAAVLRGNQCLVTIDDPGAVAEFSNGGKLTVEHLDGAYYVSAYVAGGEDPYLVDSSTTFFGMLKIAQQLGPVVA